MDKYIFIKDFIFSEDYDFCHNLAKKNMEKLVIKNWGSWNSDIYKKSFDYENTKIVMFNKKKIGFFRIKSKESIVYIEDLQIIPSMKRKGFCTKIINIIESDAKNRGKKNPINSI